MGNALSKSFSLLLSIVVLPCAGIAGIPVGSWGLSGDIVDVRMSSAGPQTTNTLSLTGHYNNGGFLIDTLPIKTEDDIAESVGWDENDLYLIQRFPKFPGKNLPRSRSLGYVEPSVFSRYATPALTSVLIPFADSNELFRLKAGQEVVILDIWRNYPEESNTYSVSTLPSGVEIQALCPGEQIEPTGNMVPIDGFEHGFTRWTFRSNLRGLNGSNEGGTLATEYKQFVPSQGKLVQTREVTCEIYFKPEGAIITNFHPDIPENSLTVWDYSQRSMLLQFYKQGLSDQNHSYALTNHLWNYPSNIIAKDFAVRNAYLVTHGIPTSWLDVPPNIQPVENRKRRNIILYGFVIISALFAGALLFRSRQIVRNGEKNKNHQQRKDEV